MINQEKIKQLVEEKTHGTLLFPVEIKVTQGNDIFIFLDSDTQVTIDDCKMISRHVESNLDRETEDFSLQVSSAGLDKPFKLLRQYKKNIGKQIKITQTNQTIIQGELISVTNDVVEIRELNKKNKKNISVPNLTIPFTEIKETILIITF